MVKLTAQLGVLVQSKFSACEAKVVKIISLSAPNSLKLKRLLVLLNKGATDALATLTTAEPNPQFSNDLTIEDVLPIEPAFYCDIERAEEFREHSDVFFKITCRSTVRVYQARPCFRTTNFISEFSKAIELSRQREFAASDFLWLSRITANVPSVDQMIRERMAERIGDYTSSRELRIFVGTWNVNSRDPEEEPRLADWLAKDEQAPDIYAIGLQELDTSKENFLLNQTSREESWRAAILAALHPAGNYEVLASERLVGITIYVFVNNAHRAHVSEVHTDAKGAGIMGTMGNKGGVAVSFKLYDSRVCFVSSHLAAHIDEYVRRNQDFAWICAELEIDNDHCKRLIDHDQIYWMGDLNYRIDGDMDSDEVRRLADAGEIDRLLASDQLKREMYNGKVFSGFNEPEIRFKPTYKFDPGTDDWDSSEKERIPAWCDRILWRGKSVSVHDYRSHPELKISDHKPVSAMFYSKVRLVDEDLCHSVYEEIVAVIKREYYIPKESVDELERCFHDLRLRI